LGNKYYAFADAVEKSWPNQTIRFDMFPYEWLAKLKDPKINTIDLLPEVPTFLLEFTIKTTEIKKIPGLEERSINEGRWYIVSLGQEGHFGKLFTELLQETGDDAHISNIEFLDRRTREAKRLELIVSFSGMPDATESELVDVLSIDKGRNQFAACFNVGQGNCNAICDTNAMPLIYYDFGGGVLGNSKTYPKNMRFCLCNQPPILLSHWDMDHWISGVHEPISQNSFWIAPRQHPIGLSHVKFAKSLHDNGKLLLWPKNQQNINTPIGKIVKLPAHSNRNYSGLIMIAQTKWRKTKKSQPLIDNILFSGDAPYYRIPGIRAYNFHSVVATHHGGKFKDQAPKAHSTHTIAYSYGDGNSYSHPKNSAINKHSRAGWSHRLDTLNGHILLNSRMRANLPKKICIVLCNMELKQA